MYMASGSLQEKFSCPILLANLSSHKKRWGPCCFSYFTTQQEEGSYLLPSYSSARERLYYSANEKLWTLFTSMAFLLENRHPNSAIFLYKRVSFPLFSQHTYCSTVACMSQIAIFCHSQINPFLLAKITFIFKVNTSLSKNSFPEALCRHTFIPY